VITFDDPRAIVAASPSVHEFCGDFTVPDYGWQNDDVIMVIAEPVDGGPVFDAPALLVDKHTGELTEVYGLLGRDPVPGLVPIGNAPE
jgi:hypothetical protein